MKSYYILGGIYIRKIIKGIVISTLSLGLLFSGGYWATPASAEDVSDETKKAYKIRDTIQKETRKMTAKQEKTYYNKVVNKIVKDAKKEKQIIKKIKLIHDRLAERITYDYDLYNNTKKANEENYWKEGAILNGTAVCNGYADVFRDILTKVGIKNKFIVSDEMDHAWNQVKIGNEYYAIDLTWDDGQDNKKYDYFLLDNKTLKERGHEEYKILKSEKATSTKYLIFSNIDDYNYIKEDKTGMYYIERHAENGKQGIFKVDFNGKVNTLHSFNGDVRVLVDTDKAFYISETTQTFKNKPEEKYYRVFSEITKNDLTKKKVLFESDIRYNIDVLENYIEVEQGIYDEAIDEDVYTTYKFYTK